jgi:phenylpropionate dioxygenase-like ring-hydroxylating dioxygenase large terminal subunit
MTTAKPIHFAVSNTVERVREDIFAAASEPREQARTLSKAAYLDPDFFAYESDAIVNAGWISLGHVSQLKDKGSYFAVEVMDEPLVVVRGEDDQIRVLSRVCPHRGTDIMHECLGTPRAGKAKRLVCPYHVWSFGLQGELKNAPEMNQAEGFRKEDWHLAEFPSTVWEGFIFVNPDGQAAPLAEQYRDMQAMVEPWNCAGMEVIYEHEWHGDFNWKVMAENWSECYHHLGAHSNTLQATWPGQAVQIADEKPYFMHTKLVYSDEAMESIRNGENYMVFPPIPGLPLEEKVDFWIFLGYPCFLLAVVKDCVLWLRLLPKSADSCTILTTILVPAEVTGLDDFAERSAKMQEIFVNFHKEDMLINVAVQDGMRSSKAVIGRLSHLEEPIWMFHRYLARQLAERA